MPTLTVTVKEGGLEVSLELTTEGRYWTLKAFERAVINGTEVLEHESVFRSVPPPAPWWEELIRTDGTPSQELLEAEARWRLQSLRDAIRTGGIKDATQEP